MASTFPALLSELLRADAGRPLVTFYDDATGERVELSVATYANWVAKTSSLFVEELDLTRGDRIRIDLPTHWLGPVFLGAAWNVGLTLVEDDDAEAFVCGPEGLEEYAAHAGDAPGGRLRPGAARGALPRPAAARRPRLRHRGLVAARRVPPVGPARGRRGGAAGDRSGHPADPVVRRPAARRRRPADHHGEPGHPRGDWPRSCSRWSRGGSTVWVAQRRPRRLGAPPRGRARDRGGPVSRPGRSRRTPRRGTGGAGSRPWSRPAARGTPWPSPGPPGRRGRHG